MATVKVDIRNLAEAWKKASRDMKIAMEVGLLSGVLKGQKHMVEKSPIDTGLYASSWDTRVISNQHITLGNSAPHAPIIEFGARPHTPPIVPLLMWAKRVLKSPAQPPEYDDEVWRLARGVQKKIQQQGQAPKHILSNEIPAIIKMVEEEIERELNLVS